ncbi:MAG TPA: proline iminopeptidase-family hydrolase [Gammaproteobacteria bacterium]|nr:proline iminopeptidase-family hydrolase [Gammaproteobacteria bacterium]
MQQQLISVNGFNIMTFHCGEGDEGLLLLSGGPGFPSNYFHESHAHYAKLGLKVVTWDTLGCGLSDKPEDVSLWTMPRFIEEIEAVREYYKLKKIHLLGQSWGGILGLEYLLAYPHYVKSFIIASSTFNVPLTQRGFERHKLALGAETVRMMAKREAEGTTDHPEYQAVVMLLAHRHLCRLEKWPECYLASITIGQSPMSTVSGKHFLNLTGWLRDYDRTADLPKVTQPCLILHGEYDAIIAENAVLSRDYLPNAELHILKNCSHTTFLEDPETYHRIVNKFLVSVMG